MGQRAPMEGMEIQRKRPRPSGEREKALGSAPPPFFFYFLAALWNLWDPSFLMRIAPRLSAMRAWSPNHWTARGFPASGNLKRRLLDKFINRGRGQSNVSVFSRPIPNGTLGLGSHPGCVLLPRLEGCTPPLAHHPPMSLETCVVGRPRTSTGVP